MRLTVDLIAEVCHEANRVLQKQFKQPVSPPWDELDTDTRESVLDGVRRALSGATPQEMHDNWVLNYTDMGWVYGEEKDKGLKTHPNLVPYRDLSNAEKFKDKLFLGIVNTFKDPI